MSPFLCIFLQLGCYIFTIDSWSLFCIVCREFVFENTMRLLPFINWHAYIELKKSFKIVEFSFVFFVFVFVFFFQNKALRKILDNCFLWLRNLETFPKMIDFKTCQFWYSTLKNIYYYCKNILQHTTKSTIFFWFITIISTIIILITNARIMNTIAIITLKLPRFAWRFS